MCELHVTARGRYNPFPLAIGNHVMPYNTPGAATSTRCGPAFAYAGCMAHPAYIWLEVWVTLRVWFHAQARGSALAL